MLDDLRRQIQRVLRLFLPLGSVDPRRSPLLVFVRFAVGRKAAVVVALVDGTGAADVGGDVCKREGKKREEKRKRRNGKLTTICETAMSVCIREKGEDQKQRREEGHRWGGLDGGRRGEGRSERTEDNTTPPHPLPRLLLLVPEAIRDRQVPLLNVTEELDERKHQRRKRTSIQGKETHSKVLSHSNRHPARQPRTAHRSDTDLSVADQKERLDGAEFRREVVVEDGTSL